MLGAVVNLAARLMQAAPGGILCDAATARAAGGAVTFDELPAVLVKGYADPVAVYRPRGVAKAAVGSAWTAPVGTLGGGTGEGDQLTDRWRLLVQASSGAPGQVSVVVIEGEAGIGKSRLVAELVAQARGAGGAGFGGGGGAGG